MRNVVLLGDVREKLKEVPDGVVQTCVTSPPYFGLRDYGTAKWEGGDPACDHVQGRPGAGRADGIVDERSQRNRDGVGSMGGDCRNCGAKRIDSQVGLEPTPEEYVASLVEVFREVRRVLRDDGTLWLNLGDSYVSKPYLTDNPQGIHLSSNVETQVKQSPIGILHNRKASLDAVGLKPKDLIGIPWRVAFALQADGWYLRSDIIWAKGNVMPESVTDRPTKSHEYIFLLTKNERYFYDIDAIREPHNMHYVQRRFTFDNARSDQYRSDRRPDMSFRYDGVPMGNPAGRNKRSVWHINPKPYKGAHFATFPEELPEVCIRAGTSEKGACSKCGAPWERTLETCKGEPDLSQRTTAHYDTKDRYGLGGGNTGFDKLAQRMREGTHHKATTGWEPTCSCGIEQTTPCIVLDPFSGSGTTLAVAKYLRRDYLGVELNPEYHKLIQERLRPAVELEVERQGYDASMELEQE